RWSQLHHRKFFSPPCGCSRSENLADRTEIGFLKWPLTLWSHRFQVWTFVGALGRENSWRNLRSEVCRIQTEYRGHCSNRRRAFFPCFILNRFAGWAFVLFFWLSVSRAAAVKKPNSSLRQRPARFTPTLAAPSSQAAQWEPELPRPSIIRLTIFPFRG